MYQELMAEAQQRANSPEGVGKLVEALLWRLPADHPLLPKFREALGNYVYAKRCRQLAFKRGVEHRHWAHRTNSSGRTFGSFNVEVEHENAQEIEKLIAADIGSAEVTRLKKEIGKSLQNLLKRRTDSQLSFPRRDSL